MAGLASVVAIYDPAHQTIHLPEGWSGNTPEELSVLVHELVHYIQHASAVKYECAEALERTAYKAQQNWLALSGHDLMRDFDLDPFTLLVRTQCFH
jgi:antirestriction protein ArdC